MKIIIFWLNHTIKLICFVGQKDYHHQKVSSFISISYELINKLMTVQRKEWGGGGGVLDNEIANLNGFQKTR